MGDCGFRIEGEKQQSKILSGKEANDIMFSNNQGFLALQKKIFKERGLDLSQYREKYLKRRIDVRMRETRAQTYLEYMIVLKRDPSEYDRLLDALTINVTQFFRDGGTFKIIKDDVLRKIISAKQKKNKKIIRVWSAGCASGEEPYSIGILFNEILGSKVDCFFISIYGTDSDANSLEKARAAEYENNSASEVEEIILRRYFRYDGKYKLKEEIKQMVKFKHHDLISDEPLTHVDIILCRNVIIYFSKELQQKLFKKFYEGLNKGGYLILGKTESLRGEPARMFQLVNMSERIYQKV